MCFFKRLIKTKKKQQQHKMGNTQYVYFNGENKENERIDVNLEENTNGDDGDVEHFKINAGNGKYSNLLKLSKTEQEFLMIKTIARFQRLKNTGFDREKDSVEVFDYYVLSAKAYFDAFIDLLMKPKEEVYLTYRRGTPADNAGVVALETEDFMSLYEKIRKNIGKFRIILIAKLNEAQGNLESGKIVAMQTFEFIFVALGALFCFKLEEALNSIRGNENRRSRYLSKQNRVLFLDDMGAFTCALWMRYFAAGIKMIGVPSSQITPYDSKATCPLYFIEHDYLHARVAPDSDEKEKMSKVFKIQRFLDSWENGPNETREAICEFFFIRYHEDDFTIFVDADKTILTLQENNFISEPKINMLPDSRSFFSAIEKEIFEKMEQITENSK